MISNKILAIILVIVVVWIYMIGYTQEPFTDMPKAVHWGKNVYYPIDREYYPVPSILNYSSKRYQPPRTIVSEEESNKPAPIAHNTPQNSPDVSSINQAGAPLDEVYSDEASLLRHMLPDEIIRTIMPQNDQLQQQGNTPTAYTKPAYEESLNIPQEQHQNTSQEKNQEESLIHELPQEHHDSEENVTNVFMPELGQRQKMEEAQYEEQIVVNVRKANYNLPLAMLLTVVLIGFIIQTR